MVPTANYALMPKMQIMLRNWYCNYFGGFFQISGPDLVQIHQTFQSYRFAVIARLLYCSTVVHETGMLNKWNIENSVDV